MPTLTEAQKLEADQGVPKELQDAALDVLQRIKEIYDAPNKAENQAVLDRLAFIHEHYGFHAYRYEVLSDGSVVALWADEPNGPVKIKAFDDMEEASLWSPREERG